MKKERNLTKERTMKQRYAFMVKAKDDALNSLIQIGKKWGVFRYAMIGFLFVFLLTYHVFYNLFIQCKVHDKLSRALAYTMVFVMVFTSIGLTSIAADPYAVEPVAATDKYETISIDTSTLNGSTIYGDGDTEFTLDKDGGFYSSKWRSSGCLPDSGRITVGSVPYQFTWTGNAPYAGKDSIRLSSASPVNTTSKTMVLKQYGVYDKIYILGTAAGFANENSSLSFTVDLYYSDGHSTHTTYTLGDWYRKSAISNSITLYTGLYRKDATYDASKPNGYVVDGHGPRLQSMAIECDETRLLSSIKFTMNTQTQTSGSTTYYLYSGIYAVTGKVSDNAPATPALYEATDADITSNSFTASWEAANNATNYYLDIATDATFSNILPEYNNKAVGNVTKYKAEGLTEGTTYYYRVRSGNNAGQSLSSTAHTVVPRFKNLPAPVLAYENTVLVGEETYLQTVSWEAIEAAGNYRWSVEVTDESNAVSTYSGDLTQPGGDGSVYVVAEGSKCWLNITNLIDGIGSYKVSVVADPVENSDEYISSNTVSETVNIVYPSVTVDITDELKASGIVSGIGGACVKAITDGVLSLAAENANAYSELGTWYKSGAVFDTGVSTSLTADTQYVDSYMLIFDINREKLELVADEEGNYTLKLLEDVELEEDLVFGGDIILDLNGNNITTNTDAVLEVNDVILRVKNGQMTDATEGTENLINTVANGVVIVEDSVVMGGLVGGNAEVSWLESNGDKHYATIKDALTGGEGKEAEDNSNLSLIRDVELTEDTTIPENITMIVPDGKELSVPENVTLRNEGSIETNGSITNAGIIANTGLANWKNDGVVANTTTGVIYNDGSMDNGSGQIDNAGIFDGEGTIANENGVINSTEGILQNQISNDGQIISEASWNEDGKKFYGPMDEAFNSAANNTDEEVTITVEKDMSMDENVTIPEHVTLEIPEDVTLTVPEGVVLDNNGEIVESGTLQVNGDLESEVSWSDGETKHYSDFNTALDKVESGEEITLLEDIIWNEDEVLEIPENVDLVIPNDVVLEIEKDKLANSENIKSETSWENDGASDVIKFGGLKEAIEESASNTENQVDILIRDDVVAKEDLTIPENVDVTINEKASLTIPEDVVVENNGNVKVNGDLVLEGTLNTDATWEDGESEFYGTFEDAMDVVSDEDSDVTDIKIVGDVVLKEDVVIPEDVNITIDDGAKLTVPEGKELENNGNIINNGTMANEGKISNNQEIINEGLVEGDGSIANSDTSKIATNDGIIKNQITDENGESSDAGVECEAVLTDPETGEKYYGGLEAVLDNTKAGDEVKLNKDEVSLKDDTVVPEGITLKIPEGSSLIVPEGTTFENNGRIENNSETGIVINEGAAINNGIIAGNGSVKNNDGYLDLTEGVINNTVESTENAEVKSEATWIIGYEVYRGSLEKALEEVANNGGGYVTIDTPNLDLEESIVIPPSVSLIVPEDTVFNIKDGVTVENNGKIVSNGEIKTEETGQLETDANWSGTQGKITYGNIEELLEELTPDENGVSDITEVTITGENVELPADREEIIIPEGVKLEIAEEASLIIPEDTQLVNKGELVVNGELGGDGTIDNMEGTIQIENGTIETTFEEGKEGSLPGAVYVETESGSYYTTLEEALSDPNAEKVVFLDDVTLEENLVIPGNITLVIPEDVVVTLGQDVVIENQGTIENSGHVDCGNGYIEGNPLENSETGTSDDLVAWKRDDNTTYYTSFKNALEKAEEGDSIVFIEDTVLMEDVVIPENVTFEIPEAVELTINPDVTLVNNGTIDNNGSISNDGVIDNMSGTAIGGEIGGDGDINAEAVWTKNGETYYGSMEEGIESVEETGGTITLHNDNVLIDDELVIPPGVTLEIPEGSSLIVPEGTTLENNGQVENNSETGIVINEGAAINNGIIAGTGSIKNNDGYLDLTEGITNNIVESTENADVKSEATWVIDYEIYRGSLEKALEEVANNGGGYVTIDTPNLDLEESIVIPPSVSFIVPEDTVVNIKDGVTVENNGKIVSNGEIKIEGTGEVDSDATWKDVQGKTTYGNIDDLLEEIAPDENGASNITEVKITGDDVELPSETEEIIIPEGVKFEIAEDASLTIPEETVLVNKGEMIVSGDIGGEGTIDNMDGTIHVEDGTIETEFEEGKEGTLKGAVLVETENGNYYTSLEEAIKDPNANKVTLLEDITLEENLSIPESLTLVIPEDVKVTLGQDVVLDNRGTIENSGHVDCGKGLMEGNLLENSETGTPNDLVAWKSDDQTTYYTTFENALDKVEEGERIIFTNDMVLSEDVEIPENVILEIPEDVELTINPGVVLQNNGTIDNNGSISNDGVIDNMSGAPIGGEIGGDGDINAEAVWTKYGETYYGSMEEGIESVEETDGTITLHNDNVLVDDELVIPPGVILEIPEGKKVVVALTGSIVNDGTVKNDGAITNNGYIVGEGTINNDNGTVNSVNGVVSNVIENGENGVVNVEASWEAGDVEYYGSLEKALESIETLGTETITITSNIVIKKDIEIPEGVTLDIQPGVTVKIDKDASLTNKGTIINYGVIGNAGSFVNDGNVEGGGVLVDMKPQNKPSNTQPSDDETKEDESAEDEVTEDVNSEDEAVEEPSKEEPSKEAEDETTEDETTEEEPSDVELSEDETPEEDDGTGDATETVKGVIEDREFFEEEHVEAEVRIQEVAEAKKETQITSVAVNFEETPDMIVAQDVNVSYGQGEVSIVIDTLDKEGSFDKGMYESVILSEVKTVVNACLTEEEKAKVENGAAAEIRLVIQVAPQKIAGEDMVKVEEFVAQMAAESTGYDVAGHVDISVEKNIEGQDWKKISKLGEEIEIKFEIPAEMKVENASYRVLRMHNGEPTLLDDLDDEESTITIRTHLFSTYSILYEKEETGSGTLLIILFILLVAGLMVAWFVRNRRKED